MHQAARLGRGEDSRGVGRPSRDQVRPFQGVDRDVDLGGGVRVADLLADVQHRCAVALSLADDDGAADVGVFHCPTHGFDRRAVRAVAVATSHEARGRDGAGLGGRHGLDADQVFHGPTLFIGLVARTALNGGSAGDR